MKEIIKKYRIIVIALLAYIIAGLYRAEILVEAVGNTWLYLKEMLEILPAVFVLTGLINAWVPAEVIIKNFGQKAGIKGKLVSLFIGSLSAGPIYAAFPLTQSLLKKGASIANTVIIISAWAVVKVPMLIVETKFLGIDFALTRYILTVPAILIMGFICEHLIKRDEVVEKAINENYELEKIMDILPGYNCGSCGYKSCNEYARTIIKDNTEYDQCLPGGDEVTKKISLIFK